jgi:hypothetical protein
VESSLCSYHQNARWNKKITGDKSFENVAEVEIFGFVNNKSKMHL